MAANRYIISKVADSNIHGGRSLVNCAGLIRT